MDREERRGNGERREGGGEQYFSMNEVFLAFRNG